MEVKQEEQMMAQEQKEQPNEEPELSKNERKRIARRESWKKSKLLKKEKKRKAKALLPQEPAVEKTEEARLTRQEYKQGKREEFLMAAEEGYKIVIDCSFEPRLKEREINSLAQQIMFSYGVNRRRSSPASLYLTGLHGVTLNKLQNVNGFDSWLAVGKTERSYTDLFKKESLVYLTADSPNEIQTLDREKVYIIGGIVDRNRLKNCTLEKAQEEGIATARLPLQSVVDFGQLTRVLTVNHVFEIMVRYGISKDWAEAVLQTMPERKKLDRKE